MAHAIKVVHQSYARTYAIVQVECVRCGANYGMDFFRAGGGENEPGGEKETAAWLLSECHPTDSETLHEL